MPKFFFYIRQGDTLASDEEGTELPDLKAAYAEALESIRDIVSAQARGGHLAVGSQSIKIIDQTGRQLVDVPFFKAFEDMPHLR